ncbi:hypothetical protein ACFU6K_24415 [Kitasatospora sp. NPDC057512]|uniref:hypothetical protein n=1 Tax=Kitasatospora sp. NPDC057512 TaxID=3346154 RepID=UPI0036856635
MTSHQDHQDHPDHRGHQDHQGHQEQSRKDRQGSRLTTHLLRRALALYPASYGTHALAEVADHAERHVRTAGPLAALREVADVAGHGVRVRFGLVSHRPAGRALAAAAPLAAALAGGYAAVHLWWAVRAAGDPDGGMRVGSLTATMALLVPAVLMAVAALVGRWTTARVLAAATVVAPLLVLLVGPDLPGAYTRGPLTYGLVGPDTVLFALNALVLLAAPPDRTTQPRSAVPWAVVIATTASDVVLALASGPGDGTFFRTGFHIVAPVVVGAAVACTTRTVRSAALTAVVLGVPPLVAPTLTGDYVMNATAVLFLVALFTVGYAVALAAVRLAGRVAGRFGPRTDPRQP